MQTRLQLARVGILAAAFMAVLVMTSSFAFADSYSDWQNQTHDPSWYATGGFGTSTWNSGNTGMSTYGATLLPNQEVPPVTGTSTSSTTGMIRLQLGTGSSSSEISFSLTVQNGMDIMDAHLHCAPAGVNGPVVVPLFDSGASSSVDVNGTLVSGNIGTGDIATSTGCLSTIGRTITDIGELRQAIAQGLIYANIHSIENPSGVARGQLMPIASGTTTMPGNSGHGMYGTSTDSWHGWYDSQNGDKDWSDDSSHSGNDSSDSAWRYHRNSDYDSNDDWQDRWSNDSDRSWDSKDSKSWSSDGWNDWRDSNNSDWNESTSSDRSRDSDRWDSEDSSDDNDW